MLWRWCWIWASSFFSVVASATFSDMMAFSCPADAGRDLCAVSWEWISACWMLGSDSALCKSRVLRRVSVRAIPFRATEELAHVLSFTMLGSQPSPGGCISAAFNPAEAMPADSC